MTANPSPRIAYTVLATLPDAKTAEEFIGWLAGGHIAAVIAGGATSADIVRLDTEGGSPDGYQVEVRYAFPTREAFDRYTATTAPALRAEGLRLFGPERGVRFARRVGVFAWSSR